MRDRRTAQRDCNHLEFFQLLTLDDVRDLLESVTLPKIARCIGVDMKISNRFRRPCGATVWFAVL
jgi:hypothetical protein